MKNDFEKDYFKLTNNAVFGKNYRKYKKSQRYKVYNNWSKIDKYEYLQVKKVYPLIKVK